MAAETSVALAAGVSPHSRISRTPVDACCCLNTRSAKILIGSDENVRRLSASGQNSLIRDAGGHLSYVRNLVTIEAEAFNDLPLHSFIGQKNHPRAVSTG